MLIKAAPGDFKGRFREIVADPLLIMSLNPFSIPTTASIKRFN